VTRFAIFSIAALVVLGIGTLRRLSLGLLSIPLPRQRRPEVAAAFALNVIAGFGAMGAAILVVWVSGGEPALARRVGEEVKAAEQISLALSLGGVLTFLVIGGLIAPVIEELVFRGMLYPAWAREWGWLSGAIATSFLFALIHANHFAQFFSSLIYICVFRRTGSLRAPIIVHGLFNMSMGIR
jgi:membrane protease YdiL (CAAX protease family)